MGAFHERGVEGDDFHQAAQAELALGEGPGDLGLGIGQGGVEEELDGVVAGFAVDVDGAGVVGGAGVVEPEVVGEPGVGFGEADELAGAGVVEVALPFSSVVQDRSSMRVSCRKVSRYSCAANRIVFSQAGSSKSRLAC